MLNLQGARDLSLAQWPQQENRQPIIMHIISIAYHYRPEVAATRYSKVWFNELSRLEVQGLTSAATFL